MSRYVTQPSLCVTRKDKRFSQPQTPPPAILYGMDDELPIPYSCVAGFVRQQMHDVRNHLNGMDLEAALLNEIVTDPEAVAAISRLRAQIRETANSLRALSGRFAQPQPSRGSITVRDLFLIWQDEANLRGLDSTGWTQAVGEERLNVDAGALAHVFAELLANAQRFGNGDRLVARATIGGGRASYELREPDTKASNPSAWGRAPFTTTHRGAYGLGLWEADRLVRANGGTVERELLPDATLLTKVSFPVE